MFGQDRHEFVTGDGFLLEEVGVADCIQSHHVVFVAHADEHLYELRAGHAEERHFCLSGHGLGDEGLARTRETYKQGS